MSDSVSWGRDGRPREGTEKGDVGVRRGVILDWDPCSCIPPSRSLGPDGGGGDKETRPIEGERKSKRRIDFSLEKNNKRRLGI
jgi:hypothetical protein